MDEKLMEQLVTRACIQDEDYWKKKKRHRFSIAYRRKKRKALREFRRTMRGETHEIRTLRYKKFAGKLVAAVGCIAVALVMIVNVTARDSKQQRLGDFVLYEFGDHIQFAEEECRSKLWKWSDDEPETTEFRKKELQYVPEGYERVEEKDSENWSFYTTTYVDADENYLNYCQYKSLLGLGVSTDGGELKKVRVDGKEGFFIPDGDYERIIWTDGTYYYTISGKFTEELLLKMAVNVN
ncbi:MAG: DUF4367 domain-containing protein [Lachnospiraceae bacterium]|nr:DUF4367 domain-containing protein [Lachnospiraceae bacterium]